MWRHGVQVFYCTAFNREAQQECKCPIELGGVGDILTKSFPGIYQINLLLISHAETILSGVCHENII